MADRRDPPLVSSDDDAGTPLLSPGPSDENESSQMMALLMQRPEMEPTEFVMVEQEDLQQETSKEFSLTVVVTATLTLLQCSLVWASYLSNSWSDTHLLTSINWQRKYFPFLNDYTDSIIQTMDLGGILSILRACQAYFLLAIVAITAVGIPCVSIMTNSMTAIRHYYYYSNKEVTTLERNYSFLLLVRFSLVIVFLFILLDLATSLTIEWTDTAFCVQNCMRASMLCYVLGMTAAMIVVAVTRWSPRTLLGTLQARRIPPAAAFRHASTWPLVAESYNDSDDTVNQPPPPPTTTTTTRRQTGMNGWYECITWQLGLATGVMLLPCFSLPLFSINYSGLAAEFMSSTERDVYLWQLPQLLWTPCSDNQWMLVLVGVVLILQIVVWPLAALFCGIALLRTTFVQQKRSLEERLLCLHPMVNSMALAVTLLLFVPSLEAITSFLLDDSSSGGLCAKLNHTTGESCLSISGSILPGTWFLLVQSIMLEVFMIILSLSWRG